jgi:hypothetical protein
VLGDALPRTAQQTTTTMAWQPDEEPLRQLVQCLKDSLTGQNPSVQKNAEIVSYPRLSTA